jgi:hypothetical protein
MRSAQVPHPKGTILFAAGLGIKTVPHRIESTKENPIEICLEGMYSMDYSDAAYLNVTRKSGNHSI